MPGPNVVPNSGNTYTCTCTRFCKGYKTGLSRATFYRHAPYRPYRPPEFSASFQAFLHNSSAPGPSTSSNLAVHEHEDSQFDNEVSRILFENQKVVSPKIHLNIYLYLSPI
jgi:hypothetical protein